jgi:uncharacterized protein (TIGR03790 family)
MKIFPRALPALVVAALLALAGSAHAQSPENVLLVINDTSPVSVRIGEYYARKRAIPQDAIVHLKVEPKDDIAPADFSRLIQAPIVKWLAEHNGHDRILYIVLTKGIPLRVAGTSGRTGTGASVDSELVLLYRRMSGVSVPLEGPLPNPYFLGDTPVAQAKPFTHQAHDIFLVTRLDGFTVDDVIGLIDRASAPVAAGRFLLDEKASWQDKGNEWLKAAADRLGAMGLASRVTLETTSRVLADESDVMGYYSWGSNDPAITRRHFAFKFVPGAIAATFVSSDGRTFTEPPESWTPANTWDNPKTFYAGSPQSLVGDLIREGATGVAGHVAEPYLDGTIRPNILFPAYASGFNLVESFYLAMPYVSWQTVVIGDPLCAPFPRKVIARGDIDKGVDAATELPALFARRALRVAAGQTSNVDAAALLVKANGRLSRGDRAGARQAFEQAVAIDARPVAPQLALASLYEEAADYDKAIERYRQVLTTAPANAVALNNLAYALAVRKNQPRDALPLAERAYALSNGDPTVADTLGWVLHLTGDDAKAAPLLAQAARLLPGNGEIHLHLAVVDSAGGMLDAAAKEFAKAIELDPALEKRPEAIALRAKLPGAAKK